MKRQWYSIHSLLSGMGVGSLRYSLCTVVSGLFVLGLVMMPGAAYAGTPMGQVLCFVLHGILMGQAGRGMATLGIAAVGVAALLGKASWGFALTVLVGIAVLFGCVGIVASLGLGVAVC